MTRPAWTGWVKKGGGWKLWENSAKTFRPCQVLAVQLFQSVATRKNFSLLVCGLVRENSFSAATFPGVVDSRFFFFFVVWDSLLKIKRLRITRWKNDSARENYLSKTIIMPVLYSANLFLLRRSGRHSGMKFSSLEKKISGNNARWWWGWMAAMMGIITWWSGMRRADEKLGNRMGIMLEWIFTLGKFVGWCGNFMVLFLQIAVTMKLFGNF